MCSSFIVNFSFCHHLIDIHLYKFFTCLGVNKICLNQADILVYEYSSGFHCVFWHSPRARDGLPELLMQDLGEKALVPKLDIFGSNLFHLDRFVAASNTSLHVYGST